MGLGGPLGNNFFICPCDLERSRSQSQGHAAKLLEMPRKITWVPLIPKFAFLGHDLDQIFQGHAKTCCRPHISRSRRPLRG